MIRRRQTNVTNGTSGHDDDKNKFGGHAFANTQQTPGSVLSCWVLAFFGVVMLLAFANYAQEHYDTTRKHPQIVNPISSSSNNNNQNVVQQEQQRRVNSDNVDDVSQQRVEMMKKGTLKGSLLTPEEEDELEYDINTGKRYHIIFSTDCSPYQHWQSFLVYYTAMKIKQPGHVTRIASGCNEEDAIAMKKWFTEDVQYLSPKRFHLHLTPHFSDIKDEDTGETIGDYKFFNKPFGSLHWLHNSPQLQYSNQTNTFPKSYEDDIVILIDPDMALLRPITSDFTSDHDTLISKNRREHILSRTVEIGKPFAQVYGFGTQWARLDLQKIAGIDTPSQHVTRQDGQWYYPVGPPYLASLVDFHRIVTSWSKFVPGTFKQYPHLLAEMFAYCIGAAHEQLPHQLIDSLMISDVSVGSGEGWEFIDAIPATDVCSVARDPLLTQKYPLPNVVHMCQRYLMGGEWLFAKRRIPSDIYDCDAPLFMEPPDNLALQFNYKKSLGSKEKTTISEKEAIRQTFMLCYLYHIVNEASTFYKQNRCSDTSPNSKINLQKTRNLVEYVQNQEAKGK